MIQQGQKTSGCDPIGFQEVYKPQNDQSLVPCGLRRGYYRPIRAPEANEGPARDVIKTPASARHEGVRRAGSSAGGALGLTGGPENQVKGNAGREACIPTP